MIKSVCIRKSANKVERMELKETMSDNKTGTIRYRTGKKGKLKIFFGYASGIGKTYAMLESSFAAKKSGADVVIGYLEPGISIEIEKMALGLERIPNVENNTNIEKNTNILKSQEFNLDAALARKPQLILIDELAHTNKKGSRHEKRYQDVKELINAGIDVYTTVNVQNLESLNDLISGIMGEDIIQRIPDSVFDEANQVELIDLEPEELLDRLRTKQKRINEETSLPSTCYNIEMFVILREIALRRMADRVNLIQERSNKEHKDVESAATEHILICLSSSPSNEKVIRQAARMSTAFRAKFTAFYVETSEFSQMLEENRERLTSNMKLAGQLGAKIVTSYGSDIVEQIAEYVKVARVTKVVFGRTYTKQRNIFAKDSFSEQLTKLVPKLEIFIVPDSYDKKYAATRKRKEQYIQKNSMIHDSIIFLLIMTITTLIAFLFQMLEFKDTNIIMIYLLAVLFCSLLVRHKLFSMLYCVASVLVFNFFFVEPYMTLAVKDTEYFMTFAIMLITAIISSLLTRKVNNYAKQSAKKAYRTEILLETSQKLQKARNQKEIMESTAEQLGKLLERPIYFFSENPINNKDPFVYFPRMKKLPVISREEYEAAEWTFKNNKHAGFSTTTFPNVKCLYLAVRNGDKVFSVVGIDMEGKEILAFERDILGAILNECALALEKAELIIEQKEAAIKLRQEQLRANLLRSISHDLRTPLTSISGNAGVLMKQTGAIEERQRQKIYMDIYDDSMWLINLVENLLSVTRIENGTMKLDLQPELIDDVIAEALKHINRKELEHQIVIDSDDDVLVANMDAKLMIQVMINLIDNAIKYTHQGSEIRISAKRMKKEIVIEVADNGDGIADDKKEKLFEMFYTVNTPITDGRRGMGLGLALCKAIINAHGGRIDVLDNQPQGAIFRLTLRAEEVTML